MGLQASLSHRTCGTYHTAPYPTQSTSPHSETLNTGPRAVLKHHRPRGQRMGVHFSACRVF